MAKKDSQQTDMIVPSEFGPVIPGARQYDRDSLNSRIAESLKKGAKIREVISLDGQGKGVLGKLLGSGDPVDYVDIAGEVRQLPTFDFEVQPGMILAVIAGAQMSARLPALVGHTVEVVRMGQEDTRKGMRVNKYLILDHGE